MLSRLLGGLFWSGRFFLRSLQIESWFRHLSCNDNYISCYDIFKDVCIEIGPVKQPFTDTNTDLFLSIDQQTRQEFCKDAMQLFKIFC